MFSLSSKGMEMDEEDFPYQVDSSDHCESPIEAYKDISGILHQMALSLGKSDGEIEIYDPFFCDGAVVDRLGSLGFAKVYNKKEDFYAIQRGGGLPNYDVLVTNPPYSEDHLEKLLAFCFSQTKPFLLLIPNYVYAKDYFTQLSARNMGKYSQMVFVCPKKRYLYTTPMGRRQKKSGKFTSPFPTFWYIWLGSHRDSMLKKLGKNLNGGSAVLVTSVGDIPLEVACEHDSRKKRQRNAEKRKKHKNRKKQKQSEQATSASSSTVSTSS